MGSLPGLCRHHVLDLQAQHYIVVDGAPFKELIVLQHVAYISSAFS